MTEISFVKASLLPQDVKWKKAQGLQRRTSVYITCQQEMDFSEALNDAMNRRRNKYFFKNLAHAELEANQWPKARHESHCLGPKDGCYLLHRLIDGEGLGRRCSGK